MIAKMHAHHGEPNRINLAALVAFMALIAPALCACSGFAIGDQLVGAVREAERAAATP